jgi:hypothetical protein
MSIHITNAYPHDLSCSLVFSVCPVGPVPLPPPFTVSSPRTLLAAMNLYALISKTLFKLDLAVRRNRAA